MMIALLRFELKYHFRQITFRMAALLFFILGILATQGNFSGTEVYANAPYALTYMTGLLSLLSVFTSILFAANVLLRDTHHKMEPVIFTTAINRWSYFGSRFLGLLLAVFLCLCFAVPGMLIGTLMAGGDRLGQFHLFHFLQPLFLLGLPNVFFISSLIFVIALWSRSSRAVYVGGVLLYILYWVASIWGNSPLMASSALKAAEHRVAAVMLDPFGLSGFMFETRYWNNVQKNIQIYAPNGTFWINRLAWASLSVLLLFICYRIFKFRILQSPASKKAAPQDKELHIVYKRYSISTSGPYAWRCFASQLQLEVRALLKHIPFLVMLLLWIFGFAVELNDDLFSGPYGIHTYPATGIVAEKLLSIRPAMLLIIFYAAELQGREKALRTQGIIYSSPVPDAAMWCAKFTTLIALTGILVTANIGIGITLQLSHGYKQLELPVYLSLYYYSGIPVMLYAVLALFIQTVVPNKYLGMLLNLALACLLLFSRKLGIEHYLLRFATMPGMSYSAMNGWGHYAHAFHWYVVYWTAFAALFALLNISLWRNYRQEKWWDRIAVMKRWAPAGKWGLALCFLTWIGTGAFIYYRTHITGHYQSSSNLLDWQVAYERKYKSLDTLPQPAIQSVKTQIALYPQKGAYTVDGSYLLKNESGVPIRKVWIDVAPGTEVKHMAFSRTTSCLPDKTFRQYWFELKEPLQPGDTATFRFSMAVVRSGFSPFDNEHSVVSNGSYIELEKYLPVPGYNERYEIDDPAIRKEKGLPERLVTTSPDASYHLVNYETILSTDRDQQVITIGDLQRSWHSKDRSYFHYRTTKPVRFMFALSSARYLVREERYKGVMLSLWYHPGQTANLDAMLQAMKDALDYCNKNFGPYTLPRLTLAEIPQYRGTATAYPGVVFSAERNNFLGDYRDKAKVNYGYATVVHEVAHQWWGHQMQPVYGPGEGLLTESLAQYTEAVVTEQRFGKMYLRNYLRADNRFYFQLREASVELPLYRTYDQPFAHYQKGGLALYALKELLGEQQVNRALSRLFHQHTFPNPRARPEDLIEELNKEANTAQRKKLIEEHLKQVIVYRLALKVLSCTPVANGQFRLDLEVSIDKTDEQQQVSGKPPAIHDVLDIAVFDQPEKDWTQYTKPFYWQQYRFDQKETRLSILLPRKPKAVAIDPYGYMLDPDPTAHISEIK